MEWAVNGEQDVRCESLLVGPQSTLGRALIGALGPDHDVRTLSPQPLPGVSGHANHVGDPKERDIAAAATSGCEAVIDLRAIMLSDDVTELDRVDAATRYILISSLGLFERYPIEYRDTEQWAPRPTTCIDDLVCHLSEVTVREILPTPQLAWAKHHARAESRRWSYRSGVLLAGVGRRESHNDPGALFHGMGDCFDRSSLQENRLWLSDTHAPAGVALGANLLEAIAFPGKRWLFQSKREHERDARVRDAVSPTAACRLDWPCHVIRAE